MNPARHIRPRLLRITRGAPILLGTLTTAGRTLAAEPPAPGGLPVPDASAPALPPAIALELGFRIGYSLPFGSVSGASSDGTGGADLSTLFSGRLPLMAELGVRLPHLSFTAVGTFAALFANGNLAVCSGADVDCSGHAFGIGADFKYHVLPARLLDPWIGLGFGYEWATLSIVRAHAITILASTDFAFSGPEFISVEAGLDVLTERPAGGVGPFLMLGVGQYSSESATNQTMHASADVANKAFHEWFTLGARGILDIPLIR
ncbi:MAG: hypothetical protein JOZ69_09675 [Myxococcales bacterium]|nr:hypothetical protein [Myxococcales bacterium]